MKRRLHFSQEGLIPEIQGWFDIWKLSVTQHMTKEGKVKPIGTGKSCEKLSTHASPGQSLALVRVVTTPNTF